MTPPRPIEVEEHSHAGMANRYVAGASRLPSALMRGYLGTELVEHTRVEPMVCPFTGEREATGWKLMVAEELSFSEPASEEELSALGELVSR